MKFFKYFIVLLIIGVVGYFVYDFAKINLCHVDVKKIDNLVTKVEESKDFGFMSVDSKYLDVAYEGSIVKGYLKEYVDSYEIYLHRDLETFDSTFKYIFKDKQIISDNVVIAENVNFSSSSEIIKFLLLKYFNTEHYVSYNDFIPLIRKVFTSSNALTPVNNGYGIYINTLVKGETISKYNTLIDKITLIKPDFNLDNSLDYKISIFVDEDYKKIYNSCSLSLNSRTIVSTGSHINLIK